MRVSIWSPTIQISVKTKRTTTIKSPWIARTALPKICHCSHSKYRKFSSCSLLLGQSMSNDQSRDGDLKTIRDKQPNRKPSSKIHCWAVKHKHIVQNYKAVKKLKYRWSRSPHSSQKRKLKAQGTEMTLNSVFLNSHSLNNRRQATCPLSVSSAGQVKTLYN